MTDKLREAAQAMIDDHQTSLQHHPDHVLVPLSAFNDMRDAMDIPKVGDGTPDAALAIGEHAFRAGYAAAVKAEQDGFTHWDEQVNVAWDAYDPPEDIKALS